MINSRVPNTLPGVPLDIM